MKINDLVEKAKLAEKEEVHLDKIRDKLGLYADFLISDYEELHNQSLLTFSWVSSWYCTDSHVGIRVYFIKDKPVAITTQTGRKADEIFFWLSDSCYRETYDYIKSLLKPEDPVDFVLPESFINEEFKTNYSDDDKVGQCIEITETMIKKSIEK